MSDYAHDMTLTADEQVRLEAAYAALSPNEAGTYARVPMGEAFDVLCNELDDILNRVCGIEEVALAYQWMQRHSWKVPDRLGGEGAVAQAGGSGSAATNGEPERAPSPPSLDTWGAIVADSDVRAVVGLVGEPPSPTGTDSPEDASLGTDASRKHGGGSPTRRLAAVPEDAA